ncbi:MAG TPA: phosphoribosylformylglycinamidine synthase, partial [Candidatus Aphodovivens excrementavium]|nr:phosphoribosylformylglycinamidine synthase [Candidatus Aphodovivens excrementavium]
LAPVKDTIPGKLPQRKLTTTAAAGYSSYGNQIGLATGQVSELYHPGYVAKRMEVGAVVGAAPARNVRRECPAPGDVVVLLGGRTGRDGIGGATGSSKAQSTASVEECGAEVQKGNAPVERKLQRLFRRGDACRLIKRCNDFGAGGVSVAIGELCDGIAVNLDVVPKKYDGLDGTELAIAESQERMAVALAAADVEEFLGYAREENLEATVVAQVTEEPRMRMTWRGDTIVDLSRAFLASNGAPKHQKAHVLLQGVEPIDPDDELADAIKEELGSLDDVYVSTVPLVPGSEDGETFAEAMSALVSDLNVCSNKGLSERFDSTIGAATVLMPFGGKTQLTPAQAMVAKFPVEGETTTVSAMSWGFNPYIMEADQFRGAYLSVVESVAKLVATGISRKTMYLSFQEYFEKLRNEADRWGKPVAAVLGALMAQVDLGVGAIGGKDSMSGSFEDLDVPPTLISFAVGTGKIGDVVSPEFKGAGHRVALVSPQYEADGLLPEKSTLLTVLDSVEELIRSGAVLSASTAGFGGMAEAVFKACVGNRIGFTVSEDYYENECCELFDHAYGSFIVELADEYELPHAEGATVIELGRTTEAYELVAYDETVDLAELQETWESGIEGVFPYRSEDETPAVDIVSFNAKAPHVFAGPAVAHPRVIIPVFPGNNCEYDTARAFERAGAVADVFVINNLTPAAVAESTHELARRIRESQIVMIPGGFSGGDEPDGSAKFITAFFRAPEVTEAVRELLQKRDGLMLGICNGFQALVKLGLVPFGDIRPMDADCPTLTYNTIGRHQSRLVRTRVASSLSPWLSECAVGDVHTVAISHGEGRFVAPQELLDKLVANGQVATQYVDESGVPSMDLSVNPNGSLLAIEGITSPDGRVFGKMGHSERSGAGLYQNVPGNLYQPIFEGGVRYFG